MRSMRDLLHVALVVAILAPIVVSLIAGVGIMLTREWPRERAVSAPVRIGLGLSFVSSAIVAMGHFGVFGQPWRGEVEFGNWISIGSYEIPAVFLLDHVSVVFSLLGAALTAIVARFSETYLHREIGYVRFFVILGFFATGTQLVAFAGALDLFFAGWEAIGIASALFIGFFHERAEPVRSSVRAFVTYRLCDVGFLIAIVATHELIGSTRLADLHRATSLPQWEVTMIGLLLLLAAFGKSAQLPFSGWLVRAMEGPTPSSALFYGAVSIHAGLYLLLRTVPLLHATPVASAVGATIGVLTAWYAAAVVRTHSDAKGALAQATLAQTGLILAEICLGLTTLALVHLVSHALLRAWQYLRAPNMLHDAHSHDHHGGAASTSPGRMEPTGALASRFYLGQLHRFRLDDRLDALIAPVLGLARAIDKLDRRYVGAIIGDGRSVER